MMLEDQDFTHELRLRCLKLALDACPALIDGGDTSDAQQVVTVAATFERYVLFGGGGQTLEQGAAHRD